MKRGVIVTGGAHGIGKAICLEFLKNDYAVCFIDIDEINGSQFVGEYEHLYFYCGDVAKKERLKEFIDFAKMKLGRIDVLVNNAGTGVAGILSDLDYDSFDKMLAVGLKAPYELSRLCKDELIKNNGKIINIASSRAFQSEPDSEAYASAKGGIVALTHALAISLGPAVLVNCIAPGWINVSDHDNFSEADKTAIPAGKVGRPEDIAKMVMFLCHHDFITGETITVDGGMSKRMIYHGDYNWQYNLDK